MTQKKISDEERDLFQNAVSDVKPLKSTHQNRSEKKEIKETKRIHIKKTESFQPERKPIVFHKTQPDVESEDIISFSQSGLQHKRLTQLRQGKMRNEATLDLHRYTTDEAIYAIDDFLLQCQTRGFRTVLIIHGKGNYSAGNKPIIKNVLNAYLRHHPLVLAFHSAKKHQGGAGALYVLIKSNKSFAP